VSGVVVGAVFLAGAAGDTHTAGVIELGVAEHDTARACVPINAGARRLEYSRIASTAVAP
jgi:hypothetical protein